MGDGPSYDHMYARMAETHQYKRSRQKRRVEMLHEILMVVGFGDTDGDLTDVEKSAARMLKESFELFNILSRS